MPQTFETYIEGEKERLTKELEAAHAAVKAAQEKVASIETEMRAVAAYEAAKRGKSAKSPDETRTRKPRETGKRREVLTLVRQFSEGATSSELQDKLGIKGDKKAVQSLANALSALKRAGQLTLSDGRYVVSTTT